MASTDGVCANTRREPHARSTSTAPVEPLALARAIFSTAFTSVKRNRHRRSRAARAGTRRRRTRPSPPSRS
jgi:hypothetical protein